MARYRLLGMGPALLLIGMTWAEDISLVEAVQRERARQAKLGSSGDPTVYTNTDLERSRQTGHITANSPYDVGRPSAARPDRRSNNRAWPQRMARAEARIQALKSKIENYESRQERLKRAPINVRRSGRRAEQLSDWEQKKAQAERDLQSALEARQRLEAEARKAGVLPGDLRGP